VRKVNSWKVSLQPLRMYLAIATLIGGFLSMASAQPPIDVGSQKQLFIDNRFVESSENVALTMNPPRRLGPVVLPDKPWESSEIGFCASVIEYEGTYMMFYRATSLDAGVSECLATSHDGEHWEKPNVGLIEFKGSKENNIVFQADNEVTVFLDPHSTPDARFKALQVRHWPDPKIGGFYIYTSPDGLHWTTSDERVLPFIPDTANQAMWDWRINKYVAYIRLWDRTDDTFGRRVVGRVEMDDITKPWPYDKTAEPYHIWGEDKIPVTSKEVPTVFKYDEQDPPDSDHYNAAAMQYPWAQDAYFLFPSAFWHQSGLLDIQMAVSRDGVRWERIARQPYIPLHFEGKDSMSLYMAIGMLRRGDEILQYYAGYEVPHDERADKAPRPIGSLCGVIQRLDGFVSADAAWGGGALTTPPITFQGTKLELNIDCSAMGMAHVEIRDANDTPIEGFTLADADIMYGNSCHKVATWKGSPDVSKLAGRAVKLHFAMRAAKLYAFQFLP